MKAYLFTLLSVIFFFFIGCKKEKSTYTLSGRIYTDCKGSPFANKSLSFFQTLSSFVSVTGGELGASVTDANGFFSFTYKPANDEPIKILTPAGSGYSLIVEGVPSKKNLSDLTFYYGSRSALKVSLNVTKGYSSIDTLYITDFRGGASFLKINGPFNNGFLYTAPDFGYEGNYNGSSKQITYKIGYNGIWKYKDFQLATCDTTRITVDVN